MAALSGITAVRPTSNTKVGGPVVFGGTVAAGQPVYKDAADHADYARLALPHNTLESLKDDS